jgi:predicted dehydrogenase
MAIRLGIIGAGIMGERLLRAAQGAGGAAGEPVEVSAVWDQDATATARLGVQPAASADAVIGASDCVYIATPPASHLGYARAALAAGKAVFLEKPLAVDVADARRFAAQASGGRVAVNFPFASSPPVHAFQRWIKDGTVGAPRGFTMEARFRQWPRPWQEAASGWLAGSAEGGFTREVLSHWLFLLRRTFGALHMRTSAAEYPADGGAERRVGAKLDAGGLPGRIQGEVGGTDRDEELCLTVTGVGRVRLRDWSIAERWRPNGTWVPDPDALPQDQMRPLVLARQLAAVAAMTRGAPHHLATPAEAFDVQEAVEAMLTGAPKPGVTRPG